MRHPLQPVALTHEQSLKTLIENRTAFTLERCELNVFETNQASYKVPLKFNDFVVTSMLRGKKVMHLFEKDGFDYLPGETVLVPASETMVIDFPEAEFKNPTQCIALAIDQQKIEKTLFELNEKYPMHYGSSWQIHHTNYHFQNSAEISILLNKIISLCSSGTVLKDVFADLALQELIVHIIQSQNRLDLNDSKIKENGDNPLHYIVGFIQANIHEEIKLGVLSEKACMSKTTFYRSFKRIYGLSPIEYILSEKIKRAKELLSKGKLGIKNVAYECGFQDVNYFIRMFKKQEGITPGQYEKLLKQG